MLLKNIRLRDYPFVYYGVKLYRKGEYVKAQEVFSRILVTNDDSSYLNFRYGMCLYKQGFWNDAITLFLKAKDKSGYNSKWDIQLESAKKSLENDLHNVATTKQKYEENPYDPKKVQDYANELYSNKSYWLAIHILEEFVQAQDAYYIDMYEVLSLCYEKLTNYDQSNHYLSHILKNERVVDQKYLYRYAYNLEKIGNQELAKQYYAKLVEQSGKDIKLFGVGLLHHKNGRWCEAALAYEEKILSGCSVEVSRELYLKCAYVYGRMYCWDRSAELYKKHIDSNDYAIAHTYFKCGESFEKAGLLKESADYYNEAILRSNDYQEYWYYRYAYVLRAQNREIEANDIFTQVRKNTIAYGIAPNTVIKNSNQTFLASYVEYYETLQIKNNFILLESFLGNSFSCNPYALLKHMLTMDVFKNFRFIVVLKDIKDLPRDVIDSRVICIKRQSDAYLRYLSSCKYLINNVSFPYYFIRKKDQIYLNTWHGTPLKTLGKDVKYPLFDYANVARNFLQCTHMISQNKFTNDILLEKYDVKDMYSGIIAETGYPRVDLTLNLSEKRKKEIISQLGLDPTKPTVVYAPTWRGTSDSKKFDANKLLQDLKYLKSSKYNLVFKAHHFAEEVIKQANIDVTLVPKDIDSNELLGCADVLISDYSSIVFDFLKCNKTIISYIYDFEEYKNIRGLYINKDEFPGEICTSIFDLRKTILSSIKVPSVSYQKYQNIYAKQDDGNCSKKVLDFIFNNDMTYQYHYIKKPVHLFFNGPYIPNGISKSFNNLIKNVLELKKFQNQAIAIVVNSEDIKAHSNRTEEFMQNYQYEVSYQARAGSMPMNIEETWIRKQFESGFEFYSAQFKKMYMKMYQREARRLFGDIVFDSVINFEGYGLFWVALLSQVKSKKKVIFQHSDIHSEWKTKHPYLKGVAGLYSEYDSIVSVSELTMQNNSHNLSALFAIPKEKFSFANNTILIDDIVNQSKALTNRDYLFDKHRGAKIITIGRLSQEKDHEKLIRAFGDAQIINLGVKLFIIGSGPLEQHLYNVIKELDLENHVYLLGQKSNPYTYLAQADLFVLSSNHEGQPMVLLEALVLNKPIIATDIVGNRSILKDEYGMLVDNSVEGISNAMKQFFSGADINVNNKKFDAVTYNNVALNQFIEAIE